MLIIRRIMSCLLGLVPFLLICAGILSFMMAVQARDPAMYSVQDDYIGDAVSFIVIGVAGLFGCYRLWRAGTSKAWALVPIAVALYAFWFPFFEFSHHGGRIQASYRRTAGHLGFITYQSMEAAKQNGRFTCTFFSDPFNSRSMFVQQGQELPYVVQCVANASGPITGAPPERPGTIVVATSPDQKKAWFAATVLPGYVSRHATWLRRDGQPIVLAQELKPNP